MAENNTRIPFRQLLLQYSNTALNIVFPLVLFPYMTRALGPKAYGVIGFYESMLLVVSVLSAFGVSYYGLRLLSKKAIGDTGQANTVLHLLLINTLIAIAGMLAYLIYVFTRQVPVGGTRITLLYGYIMVIYMFHADWYFQSQEKFRFILQRTFIARLFVLCSAFLFVQKPEHLVYYILISVVNYSIIAGASWWSLRSLLPYWKWDAGLFKNLLRALWPFALMGALGSFYFTIDTILLAGTGRLEGLGHYTVAAKIVRLGLNVFVGASIVFFVKIFRSEQDRQLQADSMLMTLHLSWPIAALLFFFAQPVILFVSGPGYLPAVPILKWLALLWVTVPLHDFFNFQVLMVNHREKWLLWVFIGASLLSLGLNLLLIPAYFTTGAAFAILFTESCVLVVSVLLSRKYFRVTPALWAEFAFALVVFPLAWAAWLLTNEWSFPPLLQLALGAFLTLAIYVLVQLLLFRSAFWRKLWFALKKR